jgi:hypothetical protein
MGCPVVRTHTVPRAVVVCKRVPHWHESLTGTSWVPPPGAATHRYIPVGLLEVLPQSMSWRPPAYSTRSSLEGLLSSEAASDWVRLSEMMLGPAPEGYRCARMGGGGFVGALAGGFVTACPRLAPTHSQPHHAASAGLCPSTRPTPTLPLLTCWRSWQAP